METASPCAPSSRRRTARAALLTLVCALSLSGASVAGAHRARAASATKTVRLQDFGLSQPLLQITAGTTVTWRFLDGAEVKHNVTSKNERHDRRFKSSHNQDHGTYSVTFNTRGVYYYECSIHPLTMQGKISVN